LLRFYFADYTHFTLVVFRTENTQLWLTSGRGEFQLEDFKQTNVMEYQQPRLRWICKIFPHKCESEWNAGDFLIVLAFRNTVLLQFIVIHTSSERSIGF
jgi:hypothetical protein